MPFKSAVRPYVPIGFVRMPIPGFTCKLFADDDQVTIIPYDAQDLEISPPQKFYKVSCLYGRNSPEATTPSTIAPHKAVGAQKVVAAMVRSFVTIFFVPIVAAPFELQIPTDRSVFKLGKFEPCRPSHDPTFVLPSSLVIRDIDG